MFDSLITEDVNNDSSLARDWSIDLLSYNSEMIHCSNTILSLPKDNGYISTLLNIFSEFGVIGGSTALKMYGLLDRDIRDVDIICNKNDRRVKKYIKCFAQDGKTDMQRKKVVYDAKVDLKKITNLKMFGVSVDLFHNNNINYRKVNGIMIQDPLDIISWKLEIFKKVNREKDKIDLYHIFSQLQTMEYLR